jgi:tetratricopeptide (TPR) repeat protein
VACRDILPGEELTICYVDNGISEAAVRQGYLREQYYFNCLCGRCKEDMKAEMARGKLKVVELEKYEAMNA